MLVLKGGSSEVNGRKCVDPVGRGFGPPKSHLRKFYMEVQMQGLGGVVRKIDTCK